MFKTRITELFGIRYPIIQGGLAFLSYAELVAAVSNAGGLGVLAVRSFTTTDAVREEIRKTRDLTDKPFGVNIPLIPAMRAVSIEDCIEVVLEEGVKIVETAARNPEPYVERLKEGGVKIIHKCPSVKFALTAERAGVDAVTILGTEGAGHSGRDEITSLVLTPLAAQALSVPVATGGGIGDARGFVAALALGAEGVTMGSRFVMTQECPIHPGLKQRLLDVKETDTVLIQRSLGEPVRAIKNKIVQQVQEIEATGHASLEELYEYIRGDRQERAWREGDFDGGTLTIGQVTGIICDLPTVKDLIDGMIEEGKEIVERLHTRILPENS